MSRKLKVNNVTIAASVALAIIYVIGCKVTGSQLDGLVFLTIAGSIGGVSGAHHWANAKEHQAKTPKND